MNLRSMRVQSTRTPESESESLKLPLVIPAEEGTMRWYMQSYHQWMREMNYSNHTIKNHRCFFGKFLRWCEDRSITRCEDVSQGLIERYQKSLYHEKDEDTGNPLTVNSQRVVGMAIHSFFRWMRKRGNLPFNPASDIELPRTEKRLPKYALSIAEVEKILSLPNVKDPVGLRDRAILELLYSTGIRREEVTKIKLFEVDAHQGSLMVRQGKGKKDRFLPVGKRAIEWIDRYVTEGRPALAAIPDHGYLFVMKQKGNPMSAKSVGAAVKSYVDQAALEKKGSCHLFRHAMANHLLENGADQKIIQQMLGHWHITSTDIYTNMSLRKLKEVHTELHPANRSAPRQERAGEEAAST
jgi:integrase/recombinase XerD